MRRPSALRYRPSVDLLDARCLPATGVSAVVTSGYLVIQGTPGNDNITVTTRPVSTRFGPGFTAVISIDGTPRLRARSPFAVVVVNSGDGDDTIAIKSSTRLGAPAIIDAGNGNDTISTTTANDTIVGGEGNDRIWGGGGRDQIDGGVGVDTINGVAERVIPTPVPPANPQPQIPGPPMIPGSPTDTQLAQDLFNLVNLERRRNGLGSLTLNSRLVQAAQIQSRNMATVDRMEHTLSGVALPTLQSRADAVGYRFSILGENIAYNFRDAGSVHWAWMNSPGHRANILGASYTEVGIAVARNVRGEIYFTQVFGRSA